MKTKRPRNSFSHVKIILKTAMKSTGLLMKFRKDFPILMLVQTIVFVASYFRAKFDGYYLN